MTTAGLGIIFLLHWWRVDIYRVTFLYQRVSDYYVLGSMGVAFFLSLYLVSKGIVKLGGLEETVGLSEGLCRSVRSYRIFSDYSHHDACLFFS